MPARLLVLQHQDSCPLGWFQEWLRDAGVELDIALLHRGRQVPTALTDHDGLLVLGGRMGANDDDTTPWLPATRALIAAVVAAGQPFLGICLGHQLAAVALGGEVVQNPHGHARGLTPVRHTPTGGTDPLIASVPDGAAAVQWNNDVVTALPPGAISLATAPDGTVQAARYGARAVGVQFHPEASPQIFTAWAQDATGVDTQRMHDIDVAAAIAQVNGHEGELRRSWAMVAGAFAATLGTAPDQVTASSQFDPDPRLSPSR